MSFEIPKAHESEEERLYSEFDHIRQLFMSQGFRKTPLNPDQDFVLFGSGLELMIAAFGTGAGWFGRHSRVQLAEPVDESRGRDHIGFLRSEKDGEEFVFAADATISTDSTEKKIKGNRRAHRKAGRETRVRLHEIKWLVPDALSELYENEQPKLISYIPERRHQAVQALRSVPLFVLGVSRDTLQSIFSDSTASRRTFEQHPIQLRLLEQIYAQLCTIRDKWLANPDSDPQTRGNQDLLKRMTEALKDIYAERSGAVSREHRDDFSDDIVHQKLFNLLAPKAGKSKDVWVEELREHAAAHPEAGKRALENPWPIAKRE